MTALRLWRAWAWALAKVERERYRRARLGVKADVDWSRLKRPARVPSVVVVDKRESVGVTDVEIVWR